MKWRYFGQANNDPKNTVAHLTQTERDSFRQEFFNIVVSRNSVKIVACVASTPACYAASYINNAEELYEFTYKPVTERFQYFLQDISRAVGEPQRGLIIADHRGKHQDERLKRHHNKLIFSSSDFVASYENLVEGLFLTESHGSIGIQFADMIAGAIGRHFNSRDSVFFNQLTPAFRARPNGSIDGYGLVRMPTLGWV